MEYRFPTPQPSRLLGGRFLSRKGDMGCFAEASQYMRNIQQRSISSLARLETASFDYDGSSLHGHASSDGEDHLARRQKKKKKSTTKPKRVLIEEQFIDNKSNIVHETMTIRPKHFPAGKPIRLSNGDYFEIPTSEEILPQIAERHKTSGRRRAYTDRVVYKDKTDDRKDYSFRSAATTSRIEKRAHEWECIERWRQQAKEFEEKERIREAELRQKVLKEKPYKDHVVHTWMISRGFNKRAIVSDKTLQELKMVFEFLDADGGGTISVDEMTKAMRLLGIKISFEDLSRLIKKFSKIGELDFDSFTRFMTQKEFNFPGAKNLSQALENFPLIVKAHSMRRSVTELIFKVLDADEGGTLCKEEILTAFKQLGLHFLESDIEKAIAKADSSGDDEIEFEEFLELLETLSELEAARAVVEEPHEQPHAVHQPQHSSPGYDIKFSKDHFLI